MQVRRAQSLRRPSLDISSPGTLHVAQRTLKLALEKLVLLELTTNPVFFLSHHLGDRILVEVNRLFGGYLLFEHQHQQPFAVFQVAQRILPIDGVLSDSFSGFFVLVHDDLDDSLEFPN